MVLRYFIYELTVLVAAFFICGSLPKSVVMKFLLREIPLGRYLCILGLLDCSLETSFIFRRREVGVEVALRRNKGWKVYFGMQFRFLSDQVSRNEASSWELLESHSCNDQKLGGLNGAYNAGKLKECNNNFVKNWKECSGSIVANWKEGSNRFVQEQEQFWCHKMVHLDYMSLELFYGNGGQLEVHALQHFVKLATASYWFQKSSMICYNMEMNLIPFCAPYWFQKSSMICYCMGINLIPFCAHKVNNVVMMLLSQFCWKTPTEWCTEKLAELTKNSLLSMKILEQLQIVFLSNKGLITCKVNSYFCKCLRLGQIWEWICINQLQRKSLQNVIWLIAWKWLKVEELQFKTLHVDVMA